MKTKNLRQYTDPSKLPFRIRLAIMLLLLVFIPSAIYQCVLVVHYKNQFTTQNDDYYSINTYYCATRFFEQINVLQSKALYPLSDELLKKPLTPDITEYELYQSAEQLHTFQKGLPLISTVGIYYRDVDLLIALQ